MKGARCPKCGADMEEGFLVDRQQNHSSGLPTWVDGEPRRHWWGALKTKGRKRYDVLTRRCRRCGFLESFASIERG